MDYPKQPFRKSDWILVGLVLGLILVIMAMVS